MSAQHKPTFKLSAAKRPVYQRLTPLAWGLIGLSVLVVVLVIAVVGVACSARPTAEPWNPTPTATVPPSPTEALPSPTATEWGQEWITPTPTEEPPCCPAWWSLVATRRRGRDGARSSRGSARWIPCSGH